MEKRMCERKHGKLRAEIVVVLKGNIISVCAILNVPIWY